jgi:cytochrome c553
VPKLRGQHPEYIVAALQGYAKGERSHATMHAHASTLSDQDMQDIAAYLSGEVVGTDGNPPPGNPPAAATVCVSCHGNRGVGVTDLGPALSGQHADYLEHALESYATGARKNDIMAQQVAQLKPQDIKQLAEYFSKQKPSLKTVPRKEKLTASK